MAEISRSVILASIAIAVFHNRCKQFAIFLAANIDPPKRRVGGAVSGHARRANTVKGVNSLLNRRKDVVWLGDTKQMPRLVLGQDLIDPLNCLRHGFLFQRAADAVAVKIHRA